MLKNALSNGQSSQVRGWLLIDGVQQKLAQVGSGFGILREPISSDVVCCDTQADLVIEVDGNQRQVVYGSARHIGCIACNQE